MKNTNSIFTLGKGTAIGLALALALMFNGAADVLGKIWTAIK